MKNVFLFLVISIAMLFSLSACLNFYPYNIFAWLFKQEYKYTIKKENNYWGSRDVLFDLDRLRLMMKKGKILLIFGLAILLLAGCSRIHIDQDKLKDIIFQSRKPGEWETISFVDPDGQSKLVYESGRAFLLSVWSDDGKRLFGLADETYHGLPASLEIENGKFKKCKLGYYYQQIQGAANIENPLEVILMDAGGLYLYDINTCEELERLVYHWDNIGGIRMFHFSYSPIRNTVVYGIVKDYHDDRHYEIISLNLGDGQSQLLGEGINPSWSSDGEKIAYFGTDGSLYIMNPDGSEPQKKVDKKFFDAWGTLPPRLTPIIQWSPDGKWLVYHRCEDGFSENCNVYKFNIQENTEDLLIIDAMYPDWNPTK